MTRTQWWLMLGCFVFLYGHAKAVAGEALVPPPQGPAPQLPTTAATPESQVPQLPAVPSIQVAQGANEKPQPGTGEKPQPPQSQDSQRQSQNQQPERSRSTDESNTSVSDTSQVSAGFSPQMIGDLPGLFGLRIIVVPTVQTIISVTNVTQTTTVLVPNPNPDLPPIPVRVTTTTPVTTTTQVPVNVLETIRVALASGGAFKIAENESPRPDDRVFLTYHFYDNITGPSSVFGTSHSSTQITTDALGNPVVTSTLFPAAAPPQSDLHREILGFEKTFLDKDASIGMRLPYFQQVDGSFGEQDIGDLSIIFKYAFINDKPCGNVLSGGLVVTVPTGPDVLTVAGNIHPVLLQPFVGYLWNFQSFYLQGFNSVVLPTDERDVTLLFNDFAVGYWLYRGGKDRFLVSVAPTLEAHLTTPLNHRSQFDPIVVPDLLVLTAGVHFGFCNRSSLTLGAATPVTGPRVYDIEAMAQFNWRF
jgi:hypothetical protein